MNTLNKPNPNKSQPLEDRFISKKKAPYLTAGFLSVLIGLPSCEFSSCTRYSHQNEKISHQQAYPREDMRGRIYQGINLYLQNMPGKDKQEILKKYDVKLADSKKQLFQEKYPWINLDKLSDADKLVIEFNLDAGEIKEISEAYQKAKKAPKDISAKLIEEFDEIRNKEEKGYERFMKSFQWIDAVNPTRDDKLFIMQEIHALRGVPCPIIH